MRRLRASQIIQIASLVVIQAYLWSGFLTRTRRFPARPTLITYGALAIAAGIVSLVVWSRRRSSLLRLSVALAYTFLLLIVDFSFFYWSYGSTANFNVSLTHLDAVYVALGTLSTAGTGNISAVSETARGIQSLQMALDLGLVLLALGMVIARLSLVSEKTPSDRSGAA